MILDLNRFGTVLIKEIREYHPAVMTFIITILTASGLMLRTSCMARFISRCTLTLGIKWPSRTSRTTLESALCMITDATLLSSGVGLVSLSLLKGLCHPRHMRALMRSTAEPPLATTSLERLLFQNTKHFLDKLL